MAPWWIALGIVVGIAASALTWLAWRHPEWWHPEIGDDDRS
jgi:hypothetical protein